MAPKLNCSSLSTMIAIILQLATLGYTINNGLVNTAYLSCSIETKVVYTWNQDSYKQCVCDVSHKLSEHIFLNRAKPCQ